MTKSEEVDMISQTVEQELQSLSELFGAYVRVQPDFEASFDKGRKVGSKPLSWNIQVEAHMVRSASQEGHFTTTIQAKGESLEAAVQNLKDQTVNLKQGFLLSSQGYSVDEPFTLGQRGLSFNDRHKHRITHFKGCEEIASYPFNYDQVSELLQSIEDKTTCEQLEPTQV